MSTTESFKLPLADVVAHLRQAFPGDGVIHVGVGAGVGEMHTWRSWGIANALLIDANAQRSAWMDSEVAANPGWHCVHAVIRDSDGESPYYEASNPAESGLLDPALLTPIWPVLKRLESKTVPAVCLDSLIRQQGITWSSQWLIVDCMPAADIIQGAAPVLEHCSFVWVRAILDDGMSLLTGASLTNITALLEPYGFHLRAVQAGINPAVGEALFIRDWQTALSLRLTELQCQFRELTQARDEQAKLAEERLTLCETVQNEKTTLTAATTDLERRISTLEKENAEIAKALDKQTRLSADQQAQIQTLQREKAELSKAREEQAKQISELKTEIDNLRKADAAQASAKAELEQRLNGEKAALAKARDEQTKLATERLAQNEALQKEKTALSSIKLDLEKRLATLETERAALTKGKEEQSKVAGDRKAQVDQLERALAEQSTRVHELETQLAEAARRHQILSDEMFKAETQIELIKDLLLREAGI